MWKIWAILSVLGMLVFGQTGIADPQTSLKLGDKFYRDSLYVMALEQYQRYSAGETSPKKLPQVLYRIAQIYAINNENENSIDAYTEFLTRFPVDVLVKSGLYERALLQEELGRFDSAADDYYRVWNGFSGSVEARESLYRAGRSFFRAENVDRGLDMYQQYITRFPTGNQIGEAVTDAVSHLLDMGRYTDARDVLNKWSKAIPVAQKQWVAELLAQEAHLAVLTKVPDSAFVRFDRLWKMDEKFVSYRKSVVLHGQLMLHEKQYKDAQSLLPLCAKAFGDSASVDELFLWSDIALESGTASVAITALNTILKTEPADSIAALYRLARAYTLQNSFLAASDALNRVAQSQKSHLASKALLKLADLHMQNGLYTTAVDAYRRYYDRGYQERRDMVLYRIARIYREKIKAPSLALQEYDKLLNWFPGSAFTGSALWECALIYEEQGEFSQAESRYRYLSSIEKGGNLGIQAQKRADYLQRYRIPDYSTALTRLTDLAIADTLSVSARRFEAAVIFREDLKNHYRSVEILDSLLLDSLDVELQGKVLFYSAETWRDIYQRLRFEYKKGSSATDYARRMVSQQCSTILASDMYRLWHDGAAFFYVKLQDGGISAYEKFVQDYGSGIYLPQVLTILAEHYRNEAQRAPVHYAQAIEYYTRLLQVGSEKEQEAAYFGIVSSCIGQNSLDSARIFLNQYDARFPTKKQSELRSWMGGNLDQASGNFAEASAQYRYILDHYPTGDYVASARFNLANSQIRTGEYAAALNNYVLFITMYPSSALEHSAWIGRADVQNRMGQHAAVVKDLSTYLSENERFASSGDLWYQYGIALEAQNDLYAAVDAYRRAVSLMKPKNTSRVAVRLAALLYDLREYNDAARFYAQALSESGDTTALMVKYVAVSLLAGNAKEVDKEYKMMRNRVKNNHESQAELLFAEGLYAYRQKDYDKAMKRFEYITSKLDRTGFTAQALYYHGLALYDSGKLENGRLVLEDLIRGYPESDLIASAYFTLAHSYASEENFAESAKNYALAVDAAENAPEMRLRSLLNAALAWQKISAWEEAGEIYSTLLAEYADDVDRSAYSLKAGFAWLKALKVKKALNYFDAAQDNASETDLPEIAYWQAVCYNRLGEYQKALELYLQIPYLYSESGKWAVTAEYEAARIYEQKGEFEKARSLYLKVLRAEGENSALGKEMIERLMVVENLMEEL